MRRAAYLENCYINEKYNNINWWLLKISLNGLKFAMFLFLYWTQIIHYTTLHCQKRENQERTWLYLIIPDIEQTVSTKNTHNTHIKPFKTLITSWRSKSPLWQYCLIITTQNLNYLNYWRELVSYRLKLRVHELPSIRAHQGYRFDDYDLPESLDSHWPASLPQLRRESPAIPRWRLSKQQITQDALYERKR